MTDEQKEQVTKLHKSGLGYKRIAATLDISVNTIKAFFRRAATPRCPQCGKTFTQKSGAKPRRFCSDKCRIAWWNAHNDCLSTHRSESHSVCECCGKVFVAFASRNRKYCSRECYYERNNKAVSTCL